MASKIAAIFLRGTRGVGKAACEEKGRDIYDLLWYMNQKVAPDFDYLIAKGIDAEDLRALFDKLTLRINRVGNKDLEQDLLPLFVDRIFIENWLKNWRESYLRLLDEYKTTTVMTLAGVQIQEHFSTSNFSFTYIYNTDDKKSVHIRYVKSDGWITFRDDNLTIEVDQTLEDKIELMSDGWISRPATHDILKHYAMLFYQKTERYMKKTNRTMCPGPHSSVHLL